MPFLPDHAFATTAPATLRAARVPAPFLTKAVGDPDRDGALLVDIAVADGRITAITAAANTRTPTDIALDGRHLWPTLVDMHVHLDKGHIVDRAPNPTGTHPGARDATSADRKAHWRHEDLVRRMTFGLRCAEVHGVSALRTHLDSHEGQGPETWGAFREIRETWKDRATVQGVALVPVDVYRTPYARQLADIVAENGGLLGGVTRASGGRHEDGLADLDDLLDQLFRLARERNLDVDLHVDESGDPQAAALPAVARATLRHGYEGRVTCGHCCSLALQDDDALARHIALVREAGIAIVTLPTVNLYLQDRVSGHTPRWRGVTPVHELRAAGIRVAVAGDNCRDPFYAYGDHDMLDTFRQGVRILHLDHPFGDAVALAGPAPADISGLGGAGRLIAGGPADFIVMNARSMDQVIARPQSDRIVVRNGKRLTVTLPFYDELSGPEHDADDSERVVG